MSVPIACMISAVTNDTAEKYAYILHFCIDAPTLSAQNITIKHITSCGASHLTIATNFLLLIHNRVSF